MCSSWGFEVSLPVNETRIGNTKINKKSYFMHTVDNKHSQIRMQLTYSGDTGTQNVTHNFGQ